MVSFDNRDTEAMSFHLARRMRILVSNSSRKEFSIWLKEVQSQILYKFFMSHEHKNISQNSISIFSQYDDYRCC